MYFTGAPEHLSAKVRIHGVDIPFMGGRVDFGVNVPTQATINIPPVKEVKDLRPNTMVHFLYRDHYRSMVCGREIYNLLFEGEIVGRSFQRVEGERAVSLHCVDFANYFIHAKQYFLDFSQGNFLGAADAAILSGVSKLSGSLLGNKANLAAFFTKSKGKRFDYVVMEIMEEVAKVNPYFEYHYERLRIHEKIYSASTEAMTKAMFQHDLFFDFLSKQLQKKGGTQSIWAILTMLLNIIHHDIVSIPAPSFIHRSELPNATASSAKKTAAQKKEEESIYAQGVGSLWSQGEIRRHTLSWREMMKKAPRDPAKKTSPYGPNQLLIKPNAWMLEPPMCNVVFPNEITQLAFSQNWQQKPTRLQFTPFHPLISQNLQSLTAIYQPDELHQYIRTNYAELSKINVKNKKAIGGTNASTALRPFHFMTDEELERGIIPSLANILPGATTILSSLAKKTAKTNTPNYKRGVNEFLHRLAEYEFMRQRAASDNLSCGITFKPSIVAGHPILFLDDSPAAFSVMGVVASGSHTIQASGIASTQIQCAMPRELSETVIDLTEVDLKKVGGGIGLVSSEPPIPEWFDTSYQHGRIGAEVYSRSLGCLGFLNGGFHSEKNITFRYPRPGLVRDEGGARIIEKSDLGLHQQEVRIKLLEAADRLKKDYIAAKSAGNEGYYTWAQTFRPITTEEQLFEGHYSGKLIGAKTFFSDHADAQDRRFTSIEADVFGKKKTTPVTTPTSTSISSTATATATATAPPAGSKQAALNTLASLQSATPTEEKDSIGFGLKDAFEFIDEAPNQKLSTGTLKNDAQGGKNTAMVSTKKEIKELVKTMPIPPADAPKRVSSGKTGEDFLRKAMELAKLPSGKYASYVFGSSGPAANGFDCSGLPYATAASFGITLERHSLDMYRYNCSAIDLDQAFKIKGAILFQFAPARRGMPNARDIKHVGISMGDGVRVFEAYNKKRGVGIFRRANKSSWTHAGLIYQIDYPGAPQQTAIVTNKTPFDQYFSSIEDRMNRIHDIRLEKAKNLQRALNAAIAFEG